MIRVGVKFSMDTFEAVIIFLTLSAYVHRPSTTLTSYFVTYFDLENCGHGRFRHVVRMKTDSNIPAHLRACRRQTGLLHAPVEARRPSTSVCSSFSGEPRL